MSHNTVTLSIAALAFTSVVSLSTAIADVVEEELVRAIEPANHCVVELSPVAKGAKSSAAIDVGCFDSFSEAIEAATQGELLLPYWASPESVTEEDFADSRVRWIIGIDYDGFNYRGASLTWSTPYYGCYDGSYRANMPAYFNNRLSSTRGFTGCRRNTSYDLRNQRGSWVRCFPNCSLQGFFMNNRTTSKRWDR
jgi:hypothetical protein